MIATVALEGRKGEMDACSNLIASGEAINEDLAKRDPNYVYFEEMDACSNLIASGEAMNEDLAKRDPSYVYFEEI